MLERTQVAISFSDNTRLTWLGEEANDILMYRNIGIVWPALERGLWEEMSAIWCSLKNIVALAAAYCD